MGRWPSLCRGDCKLAIANLKLQKDPGGGPRAVRASYKPAAGLIARTALRIPHRASPNLQFAILNGQFAILLLVLLAFTAPVALGQTLPRITALYPPGA